MFFLLVVGWGSLLVLYPLVYLIRIHRVWLREKLAFKWFCDIIGKCCGLCSKHCRRSKPMTGDLLGDSLLDLSSLGSLGIRDTQSLELASMRQFELHIAANEFDATFAPVDIQCSAGNLTALLYSIRQQIGIVDTISLSVYDEGFEEYCLVVSMDELDQKSQVKVHKDVTSQGSE